MELPSSFLEENNPASYLDYNNHRLQERAVGIACFISYPGITKTGMTRSNLSVDKGTQIRRVQMQDKGLGDRALCRTIHVTCRASASQLQSRNNLLAIPLLIQKPTTVTSDIMTTEENSHGKLWLLLEFPYTRFCNDITVLP